MDLRKFVEDVAAHGIKADINPTHQSDTIQEVEEFWHDYIRRIDRSMREAANECLSPAQELTVVGKHSKWGDIAFRLVRRVFNTRLDAAFFSYQILRMDGTDAGEVDQNKMVRLSHPNEVIAKFMGDYELALSDIDSEGFFELKKLIVDSVRQQQPDFFKV
jgi:hypothetical protein